MSEQDKLREAAEWEYFDGVEEDESNYRRFNAFRAGWEARQPEVERLLVSEADVINNFIVDVKIRAGMWANLEGCPMEDFIPAAMDSVFKGRYKAALDTEV